MASLRGGKESCQEFSELQNRVYDDIYKRIDETNTDKIAEALYNPSRRHILTFLYAYGPLWFKDIKKYFDLKPNTLAYHLKKLKNAGLINNRYRPERTDEGYSEYSISELGVKFIEIVGIKDDLDRIKVKKK